MKAMFQVGLVALVAVALMAAVGCGEKSEAPAKPAEKAPVVTVPGIEKVTYTCPMHPEVKSDKPGKCPKCNMDLVPEKKAAAAAVSAATSAVVEADTSGIAQRFCPVTGDKINTKIFVEYQGRKIYFCCEGCPAKFNANPEKYIKIVDAQLKEAAAAAATTK